MNYLTKENILNVMLFVQFVLINVTQIFTFEEEAIKYISLALMCIGYWINTKNKEV